MPIKSLPEGKKVLCSLIDPGIREGDCYDTWKFVARHYANRSSCIKVIGFYQSLIPVEHSDSFRINIAVAAMNILTDRIFDVSNAFQNKNIPIHERVFVSPPPYYLEWFEIFYPNVPLNRDYGTFFFNA